MMAQLVEQRIRNAWVAGSSPARGSLFSSASRACISLQKFFVCEISTSVVHGLPKPVRRVRLPYLAPSTRKDSRFSFPSPRTNSLISATGDTQKVAEGVLGFDYIWQYQLKRQYK